MNRLTLILWDFSKAFGLLWVFFTATNTGISQSPGNRLSYLDKEDPFYVGLNFPKFSPGRPTPQMKVSTPSTTLIFQLNPAFSL